MGNANRNRRFLLLQMRNPDDPMRQQEVECFLETLPCDADRLEVHSLLEGPPPDALLRRADIVLLGGSGDHSVVEGGPWLAHALDTMRELAERAQPTFASCWGFQAMARALGGEVETDLARAELGSVAFYLTEAGRFDPVFGVLPPTFLAQAGHHDVVSRLPESAERLAGSRLVENQAFRLPGKPIYCTQFHPELNRARLRQRLEAYPQYVERIAEVSLEEFYAHASETPDAPRVLRRFIEVFAS